MGLGLASFLNHNEGSSRKFLKDWKKAGSIIIWLYTRADIAWASWNHPFIMYGTYKDKEGNEIECLKYPRFVSPDLEAVHQNQYFRNEDDTLQVSPALDPFIRLREWLRLECDLPLDTVVFRWENPNPRPGKNPIIEWRRGHLARLVDRGQANFGASLDTKLDYFFVVTDNEKPAEGCQIVRGTKLLGDRMKEEIRQQIESNGDLGNPLMNPYAIKWVYDADARSPMDSYKAFRFNNAVLTDQIKESITNSEYPDPSQDCKPRDGDKAKIRAAMEAAAQIEIPWDQIFVPEWTDEEKAETSALSSQASSQGAANSQGATTPSSSQASSQGASQVTGATSGPKTRYRKKKTTPKPPPVEMIKCDDCDEMLPVTAAKCPKCGAEYEVDETPPAEPEPRVSTPTETETATPAPSSGGDEKCWSCGGFVVDGKCTQCGLEAGDDIPF